MRRVLIKNRSAVFSSWLLSYLLILLLPIFISSFIYLEAVNIVKEQVNLTNKALIKQVEETLDNQMKDVLRISWQIYLNPRVQYAMYYKPELTDDKRYVMFNIINDLKSYQTLNSAIDNIYIYFKNTDLVLSTSTINSPKEFYSMNHSNKNISYDEWYKQIKNSNKLDYIPLETSAELGESEVTSKKTIACIQPLPVGSKDGAPATLVILMDEQRFSKAIEGTKLVQQGDVFIIDEQNKIMSSTNGIRNLPGNLSYDALQNDTIKENINFDGKQVALSCITSSFSKWKYVSIVPESIFTQKIRYIQKLTVLTMLGCILIGVLVAYLFSKKNYGPIDRLMKKTSGVFGADYAIDKNEFNFIEAKIDTAISERKVIDDRLEQQNKVIKYNYLARLIKGRLDNSISMETSLTTFGLKFDKEYLAIMLFYIEDYEGFFSKDGDKNKSIDEKFKLVEFIFTNVVEDVVDKESQVFLVEVDDTICCLLNYNAENQEEAKEQLVEVAQHSQRFIQDKLHIYFSVALSNNHKDIATINLAYQEALEAMEYKMIMGYSTIICYSDIKVSGNKYKYTLETEQQLINFIKTGDCEKAEVIVNDIFHKNFSNNYLSVEMTKWFIFDIVSTVVKIIDEVSSNRETPFVEEVYPVERLAKCENIMDMKEELISILRSVCCHVNKNKKKHNIVLRDDIINFVKVNYGCVDLDVSMIATKFNLNQSYLSTFFKESFGQGLLDYINKVRIDNAKILLLEKYTSIADTAIKVGFYNSNTFIRIFKKYEGVTPIAINLTEPLNASNSTL